MILPSMDFSAFLAPDLFHNQETSTSNSQKTWEY